jgi:hypothetical protein
VYVNVKGLTGDEQWVLGETAQGIRAGEWVYLELKVQLKGRFGWNDGTNGRVVIRANMVTIFDYTGDPGATSWGYTYSNNWTSMRLLNFASASGTVTSKMCDLYLVDLQGSGDQKRDFLGDGTINYIVPNGVGASSAWTPTPAVPNWSNVEEIPPDDATSYVSADTAAMRDSYQMTDIPLTAEPKLFQWVAYMKKQTEGGCVVKPVFRAGGINYDGPGQGVASTSYRYQLQIYDTNPATGLTITPAQINAAEFGAIKDV